MLVAGWPSAFVSVTVTTVAAVLEQLFEVAAEHDGVSAVIEVAEGEPTTVAAVTPNLTFMGVEIVP